MGWCRPRVRFKEGSEGRCKDGRVVWHRSGVRFKQGCRGFGVVWRRRCKVQAMVPSKVSGWHGAALESGSGWTGARAVKQDSGCQVRVVTGGCGLV